MDYRILGPLEVLDDGRRIELGAGRQTTLLALLLVEANRVVSTDRLIDALWDERPPPTASKALQNLISQLRRALGHPERAQLLTRSPGYVLELEPGDLDRQRFEHLADEGRRLLDHDAARAADRLREALMLWRGRALADVAYEPFAQDEVARLEELRLAALEDRIEAELALGLHAALVAELDSLVTAHPVRERFRAQLMVALYRCDRQAEALEVYQEGRRRLAEDLGLEPGKTLQQLERKILNHDPALELPEPRSRHERRGPVPEDQPEPEPSRAPPDSVGDSPRRRRRSAVLAAIALLGLALVVAAVLAALASTGDDGPPPVVVPNSLVRIDPETNAVVDVIRVGGNPTAVKAAAGNLFVVTGRTHVLARVDPRSGDVVAAGQLDFPFGIADQGDGTLWVTTFNEHTLVRMDAETLEPLERIPLPGPHAGGVAVGGGSVWVTHPFTSSRAALPDRVSRLREGRVVSTVRLPPGAIAVAFGNGAAWVPSVDAAVVSRIDAATGTVERFGVGSIPLAVVFGFGSVWTVNGGDGTVVRLNPLTGKTQSVIRVGSRPWGIAIGAASVWVSSEDDGTVTRIDPRTNEPVNTIELGRRFVHDIAFADGSVWVAVGDGEPSF